jgi:hypothetical protein
MRYAPSSQLPFCVARTSALVPSGSASLTLAPLSTNAFTDSSLPSWTAKSSALNAGRAPAAAAGSAPPTAPVKTPPPLGAGRPPRPAGAAAVEPVFTLMSAPASTSTLIAATFPSAAAHISGVCPRELSFAFGSAP